jgi:hypothetical protein
MIRTAYTAESEEAERQPLNLSSPPLTLAGVMEANLRVPVASAEQA